MRKQNEKKGIVPPKKKKPSSGYRDDIDNDSGYES